MASWGNLLRSSACSASAVCLAAAQVPRSCIEYDRSTSKDTTAALRRSVTATSKSRAASLTGAPGSGRPPRSSAFRTVAGTSSGCSSPNSQARGPDLKQLVYILTVTADGAVPLGRVLAGDVGQRRLAPG